MENHIGLTQFDGICKQFFDQRATVQGIKDKLKEEQEKLDVLESQLLHIMEETNREKVHVAGHGLIYTVDRFTVQTPKSLDDKKRLFKYLTDKGIFFEMASVNSQTLNSFYKTEMEQAVSEGNVDFKIPGVGDPSHIRTLSVRKESK